MEIIFRNAWAMFIVVTFLNGFILMYRSRKHIAMNPDLKEGYSKCFKGIIFYGNIPWIIMGIGNLSGMTNNVFEYFDPKGLNPMVLAFHAAIIILWMMSIVWIYFKDGDVFIEVHPGLLKASGFNGNRNVTARQVRLFYPVMLLGGIIAMIIMWIVTIPVPHV